MRHIEFISRTLISKNLIFNPFPFSAKPGDKPEDQWGKLTIWGKPKNGPGKIDNKTQYLYLEYILHQ